MRIPGTKGPIRKRKIDQLQTTDQNAPIMEEFKPKTKQGKLNKKSFNSMITSFTTSFVDANDTRAEEDDVFDLFRDDNTSEYSSQSTKNSLLSKEEKDFECKLSNFKFGPGAETKFGRSFSNISEATSDPSSNTIEINIDGSDRPQNATSGQTMNNEKAAKGKANKSNISKFAFGKKNSGLNIGEVDLTEHKFWLEVFDFTQDKWVQVEPLRRRVYDDLEDVRRRLHGTASLFIVTFQKYEFKDEEAKKKVERHKYYHARDLTVGYIDRYHKLLVSRRELNLNLWWNQVIGYFKFDPELTSGR